MKINNTQYENIEKTPFQYLIDINRKYPNFVAIDFLGRKFKFDEFEEKTMEVKNAFINSGVKPGDTVSILYLTTPETIFSLYALLEIGAVVNFLNPIEPDSIEDALEIEKPKYVICFDEFYPMIKGKVADEQIIFTNPTDSFPKGIQMLEKFKKYITERKKIKLPDKSTKWADFIKNKRTNIICNKENSHPLARGIHLGTGGSSGLPKQVQLSNILLNNIVKQHYLMNNSSAFNLEIDRGDTLLDVIPPHLGYGVCDIHLSLAFGLTLAIAPDPNPKNFISDVKKYKPNFILAAPVHWKEYNKYKRKIKTPYIKVAVSGGEKLEQEDENDTNKNFEKRGVKTPIREGVGLTEIAGVATFNSSPTICKYTVGRPLPEYVIGIFKVDLEEEHSDNIHISDSICQLFYRKENGEFIIDHTGNLGEQYRGEICYLLPIEIDGYVGEKMQLENGYLIRKHEDGKNWIHTGDYGYIREDRNLIIVDRIKRVFNRKSFKVYPNAIENKANDSGMINECIVIPRKSFDNVEVNVPIMYVVMRPEYIGKEEEFISYCKKTFVGINQIYQFIFMDELPKTSAGKKSFKSLIAYDSISYPPAKSESLTINYESPTRVEIKLLKKSRN